MNFGPANDEANFGGSMKSKIFHFLATCAMAIVFLCLSAPAFAQFRTSIQGTVTDPTQAVIPGATVTIKDLQTDEVRTSTSNSSGVYNFNALPSDHFDLTAEKSGFQKQIISDVQLIPEQANSVNVILQPGGASTTVTVNGNTVPALD